MSIRKADLALTRRGLLRLGSAAAAAPALLPFLPFLESDAEAAGYPRRLLLYFIPLGTRFKEFRPSGGELDFTLGRVLAPLAKHRSKIVVLDGIDNIAATGGPGTGGHTSVVNLFTGVPAANDSTNSGDGNVFGWPIGPSVDQFIAAEISKTAPTPVSSIETGVAIDGKYHSRISFKGANQPVPPMNDPAAVYAKVFADFKVAPGQLDKIRAARSSVIDTVKGDLARITARVPALDRPKLEAHLANIRAIESKLSVAAAACDRVPGAPAALALTDANNPALLDLHFSLITAAFACNITRVASVLAGRERRALGPVPWLNLGLADEQHAISHRTDPVGYEALIKISIWEYDQLRILMDKLSAVPEGTGTMLDNTLIVCASNMGDPARHTWRSVPVVLAGGCGGAIKTGRYLKFGNYNPDGARNAEYGGQPMNNVLTSACRAMGFLPGTTFGDMKFSTGPLPGLLA